MPAGRAWRITLGIVLTGTALLAPADQIHIHTLTSLQKHIGFGLFFAAPFAGIGLTRIIGDHFRRAQVGIAIWGAALVIGMTQANDLFDGWPDSSAFVPVLAHYLQPGAHYLVEVDEVPIYYLRHHADAQPDQFTSTYFIGYSRPGPVPDRDRPASSPRSRPATSRWSPSTARSPQPWTMSWPAPCGPTLTTGSPPRSRRTGTPSPTTSGSGARPSLAITPAGSPRSRRPGPGPRGRCAAGTAR